MLVNKQNKENYMYEISSGVLRKRRPFVKEEKSACSRQVCAHLNCYIVFLKATTCYKINQKLRRNSLKIKPCSPNTVMHAFVINHKSKTGSGLIGRTSTSLKCSHIYLRYPSNNWNFYYSICLSWMTGSCWGCAFRFAPLRGEDN